MRTLLEGIQPGKVSPVDRDAMNMALFGDVTATERNLREPPPAESAPKRDVTKERLGEVASSNNFGGDKVAWTKKAINAPLTATEKAVLDRIPEGGLDLGFISKALLYSGPIRGMSKPERAALYSLLDRGTLRHVAGVR